MLTVDHGQPRLVQKAHPAVLEEPDGEDGEREQQDEGEQAHAVLPVALLRLLLRGEFLHGAAVLSRRPRGGRGRDAQPPTQQQREQGQQQQPRWRCPSRPSRAEARRVTRLHGPRAARASCARGPTARAVGGFPRRRRPARVAAAAAAPPPPRAPGRGCAGRRVGEGRAQCAGSPSTAPRPRTCSAPSRAAPRGAERSRRGLNSLGWGPPTQGSGRRLPACLHSSPGPGVPGQAVWGRGAVPGQSPPRFLNATPEVAGAWPERQLGFARCAILGPVSGAPSEVVRLRPGCGHPEPRTRGGRWGAPWGKRRFAKPRCPFHLSFHNSHSTFQLSGLPRLNQASFKPLL